MKETVLVLLAAVGVYAVYEWYAKQKKTPGVAMRTAQNVGTGSHSTATAAAVTSEAIGLTGPLVPGIPAFHGPAIANGHGDQIAAALPSNRWSTSNGGPN